MENDFFKDFRQKWKVRDGVVFFQKLFVKQWGFFNGSLSSNGFFQQRFDDGSLQIMWYNASGKRCVDDVHDSQQEDVKVFIKKRVLIIFKTNSSVAGSKVSKGFPVKEVSWRAFGF